ncbi:MAG: hypothetical protein AAF645_24300 [Myxococcota bacterium]
MDLGHGEIFDGVRRVWAAAFLAFGCGGDPPPSVPIDGSFLDRSQPEAALIDGDLQDDRQVRGERPVFAPADIEVVLPFQGPAQLVDETVGAQSGRLDVVFNVDTTSSFQEEIGTLQDDLATRIVPQIEGRVEDVAFGVSRFEDFPIEPHGAPGDVPFELLTPVTTSRSRLAGGVRALGSLGGGGDAPESAFEALYQLATGEGFISNRRTFVPSRSGIGGADFREDALHVIVHATDAPASRPANYVSIPGTHGLIDVTRAMNEIDAFVLGIVASDEARPDVEAVARNTGAVIAAEGGACPTGIGGAPRTTLTDCPLVFDVAPDGAGLSDAIVTAVIDLLDGVAFDEVYARVEGDTFGFVQAVRATDARNDGTLPGRADLRPIDGTLDTFTNVRFGTELDFEIVLQNRTLPPEDYDQSLRFTIEFIGDGQLLTSRSVRVTVPLERRTRDAGVPDSAAFDGAVDGAVDGGISDGSMDDGSFEAGPNDGGAIDGDLADAPADDASVDGATDTADSDASSETDAGSDADG